MRLDAYLVQHGCFESRARAQAAVKAGLVRIGGAVATKPSASVPAGAEVNVDGDVHPYVSRGGVKLEAALCAFETDPAGKVCLDLGASTGGFTDVLLKRGAAKVYAVDVGTGQLHPSLLGDPRVVALERTHAKDLSRKLIPEAIDVLVCDVSFISLKKALPPAMALCAPGARLVALIKPQFEVGRSRIGKGGIVKLGYANSYGVCEDICAWICEQEGWKAPTFMASPVAGGDGNKEFLLGAIKTA
jgi:23S rRNA (cytidine1920-2'-O)/16S rRNA (cytidine1409-2'-O)-methyltransferase